MTYEERVRQLNEDALEALVEAHKARVDEPLVLAIECETEKPEDIALLEVLRNFPGGDDDELMPISYEPSANLRIFGELHLVLGSPEQALRAIQRGDLIRAPLRVLYDDGSEDAQELLRRMGL